MWILACSIFNIHIFWEGHKILWNIHQLFDWQYISRTNNWWRFCKILWPSPNEWTLTFIYLLHETDPVFFHRFSSVFCDIIIIQYSMHSIILSFRLLCSLLYLSLCTSYSVFEKEKNFWGKAKTLMLYFCFYRLGRRFCICSKKSRFK